MGVGFTEVRRRFKRAQIDLGVRDTAESPRDLREALLRAGMTEKIGLTGGALGSAGSAHAGCGSVGPSAEEKTAAWIGPSVGGGKREGAGPGAGSWAAWDERKRGRGCGLGWAAFGFLLFLDFPNPFLFLFWFFKLKSI